MDEALRRTFVWSPPSGFTANVVSQALPEFSNLLKRPRILGAYVFQGAIVALVAIAIVCLTMLLFVEAGVPLLLAMATHALPVAWASAAVSVCVSIWLTRRVLR
jgi:hypothetical protein